MKHKWLGVIELDATRRSGDHDNDDGGEVYQDRIEGDKTTAPEEIRGPRDVVDGDDDDNDDGNQQGTLISVGISL